MLVLYNTPACGFSTLLTKVKKFPRGGCAGASVCGGLAQVFVEVLPMFHCLLLSCLKMKGFRTETIKGFRTETMKGFRTETRTTYTDRAQ